MDLIPREGIPAGGNANHRIKISLDINNTREAHNSGSFREDLKILAYNK